MCSYVKDSNLIQINKLNYHFAEALSYVNSKCKLITMIEKYISQICILNCGNSKVFYWICNLDKFDAENRLQSKCREDNRATDTLLHAVQRIADRMLLQAQPTKHREVVDFRVYR